MFTRMFSRSVLVKSLLPTTQSRQPVIARSLEQNARSTLLHVRKFMPQLKRSTSVERRTLTSERLDAFRRVAGDTNGQQYARYLPAVVPAEPDVVSQTEGTVRNGQPNVERRTLTSERLDAFRRVAGDINGQQYARYLPAVVPAEPDVVNQTEGTVRNGQPNDERKSLISEPLDASRQTNGVQYARYLPAVVPAEPDEIGQPEETARNDHSNTKVVQSSPALALDSLLRTSMLDWLVCVMAATAKMWWDHLTPEAKRHYITRMAGWRKVLRAAVAFLCGLFATFLWSNTELDPATGRRRLFLYDDLLLERRAYREVKTLVKHYESLGMLLDTSHPVYKRVFRLTMKMLEANVDVAAVRDRQWYVVVVDDRRTGAFVTLNGCIFVTTGLAGHANDDQLSIIVGHEMSHCTQRHSNQKMSAQLVLDVAHLAATAVIWVALPFYWAIFAQMLVTVFQRVLLELPLSRAVETEADRDGLMMAAKACVNVTEGGRYWRQTDERTKRKSDRMWWKSTHPSHSTRAHRLTALVPEARELQKSVGCDALPTRR